MKFQVITEVYTEKENGKISHIKFKKEFAETSNPVTAVVMTGQDFFNKDQEECDNSGMEQERITGVFEVVGSKIGAYNHLDAINDSQRRSIWGTEQWERAEALEKLIKENGGN